MTIITESPRLVLSKIDINDTDRLFQLTGDKRVMKYFPKIFSYSETVEMIEEVSKQYKKYGYCFWKVVRKEKEAFIGIAGLLHQEIDGYEEMEISYRIKPEYWNRGYAEEAARACKKYAENELNPKRLISIIHPQNLASKRVAEKLGAKKTMMSDFLGKAHEIYVYEFSCDSSSFP